MKPLHPGRTLWLITCEKASRLPLDMEGVRARYKLPDGTLRWLVEGRSDLDVLLQNNPSILSVEAVDLNAGAAYWRHL